MLEIKYTALIHLLSDGPRPIKRLSHQPHLVDLPAFHVIPLITPESSRCFCAITILAHPEDENRRILVEAFALFRSVATTEFSLKWRPEHVVDVTSTTRRASGAKRQEQ